VCCLWVVGAAAFDGGFRGRDGVCTRSSGGGGSCSVAAVRAGAGAQCDGRGGGVGAHGCGGGALRCRVRGGSRCGRVVVTGA